MKRFKLVCFFALCIHLAGCSPIAGIQHADVYMEDRMIAQQIDVVPEGRSGKVWVPLSVISSCLGMSVYEKDNALLIGSTGPAYTLQPGQTAAFLGDKPVTVADAPKYIGNEVYVSDRTVTDLWTFPVHWDSQRKRIGIASADHKQLSSWLNAYNYTNSPTQLSHFQTGQYRAMTSAAKPNSAAIVAYAKTLQGAPYQFAADPEATSAAAAFDAPSFVRHVFGHFGITLPRRAISQAELGTTVADENLQPGDLMFFDMQKEPSGSRYVSHVAIYTGNNRFIHTYGADGVTVSELSGEWRSRYLFAKRWG
ncbi:NlpC/P60 family protein [Paenibacillus thalictri]|uniref:NlpC/P60 domain-containing protein n=1 Tax=Paenibacillus thalictri TaxID=2527873 RepID=A0A4Q9DXZ3_9BACL|nr:NlpC/P60 family protein [Paenibacillus thalictri]TBL81265.1 hypothetical protein EYB31_04025 [Paenibacillus thalictri]